MLHLKTARVQGDLRQWPPLRSAPAPPMAGGSETGRILDTKVRNIPEVRTILVRVQADADLRNDQVMPLDDEANPL